jgi:hypothetical protein
MMASPEFEWYGDLGDACWAVRGDYYAYCEDMGDGWFCQVRGPGGSQVFHSTDTGILPLTGDAARLLCSLVVRAELGGEHGR